MTDLKAVDVDRRRFLNRTLIAALSVFSVAFGGGSIAILWPRKKENGYGAKIDVGSLKDVYYQLDRLLEGAPLYHQVGRFYILRYAGDREDWYTERGVLSHGLMALYQKCPHLGCRTPFCSTSDQFECPCHAAFFNKAGERLAGSPAPAGMWRFPIEVVDGRVIVDTSRPVAQPPLGFDSMHTVVSPGSRCVR
jgi:cytochrome b6-f complex iron-sulfur subunit